MLYCPIFIAVRLRQIIFFCSFALDEKSKNKPLIPIKEYVVKHLFRMLFTGMFLPEFAHN